MDIDLEQYESDRDNGVTAEELRAATFAEAQKFMARVKFFRQKKAELAAVYDDEVARLRAEIASQQARKIEALAPYTRREQYYTAALEAFAVAEVGSRKRDKTVKLPGGDLAVENQKPKWEWPTNEDLIDVVRECRPDLVAARTVYSVDKTVLKGAALVQDGRAYLPNANGELVELPVLVAPQAPKVTITIA